MTAAAAPAAAVPASALSAAALRVRALQPFTNAYTHAFDAETMERVSAMPSSDAAPAASAASPSPPPLPLPQRSPLPPSVRPLSSPLLISLKDNFALSGMRTTAASRMLSAFVPHYDSTVASKLKQHGAIITGKTNMDEFGMGSDSQREK